MLSGAILRRAGAVYGLYAAGVLLGFAVHRRRASSAFSFGEELRRSRLRAFRRFPLRQVGRALLADDVPRTAAAMTAVNLGGAAAHFLAGLFYLSPLLAAGQGFLVGSMLATARNARTYLFTAAVLPFEVGAFALGGGLGIRLGERLRGKGSGARLALAAGRPELRRGLALVVLLQGIGGLLEAVGAIRLGLPGLLSRDEIAAAVGVAPPDAGRRGSPGGWG